HEHAVRLPGRPLHVMYAATGVLVLQRLLRQVARVEPLVAPTPGAAGVIAEPHPRRGNGDRELVGVPRPGADRIQAQPAAARLPMGSRGLVPESRVDLPAGSAVVALEQDAWVSSGVQGSVRLATGDDPDPLQRLIATVGQGDAVGLLPLGLGVTVH